LCICLPACCNPSGCHDSRWDS
jgi:pyruv_ox_red: pyruvate:ferredoxin (flavodoxin) oxidoreductase